MAARDLLQFNSERQFDVGLIYRRGQRDELLEAVSIGLKSTT
jgi:hypothetical protein